MKITVKTASFEFETQNITALSATQFEADFDGEYKLLVVKNGMDFHVENAVDGYGKNVAALFSGAKVTVKTNSRNVGNYESKIIKMPTQGRYAPVEVDEAEQITSDIVMPILNLATATHMAADEETPAMIKLDFDKVVSGLHFWQAMIAGYSVQVQNDKILSMIEAAKEYHVENMVTYTVLNNIAETIKSDQTVYEDNIQFAKEKLFELGVKM